MKLFQQFGALVQSGVVVHLTLRQCGNEMQVEILPVSDSGKTGIVIPPRAVQATPSELDEKMPAFLETYLASAGNLNEQIAVAGMLMKEAEQNAQTAIKEAAAKKATPKAGSSTGSANKNASSLPGKKRDMGAGLIDDDEGEGEGERDGEGSGNPVAEGTGEPSAPVDGMVHKDVGEPNLFML